MVRHGGNFKDRWSSFAGASGAIFMAFFISISTSIIGPFRCISHPGGDFTVNDYPSVICWDNRNDHLLMIIMSCIGLSAPVGFYSWALYAVSRYHVRVAQGNTKFLNTYAFLFFRFRNSTYWYSIVILTRNLLLALVTVIPFSSGQLVVFTAIVLPSLGCQAYFVPWRASHCNGIEVLCLMGLQALVCFSGLFVSEVNTVFVSYLCLCVLCALLLVLVAALLAGLYSRFAHAEKKPFSFFLCHHKAGAGSFARLLKMILKDNVAKKVWLDSDDLQDINLLFGYVQYQVETVVVLGSKGILERKWCVGEMNAARLVDIRTLVVLFPDFVFPDEDYVKNYSVLVPDVTELANHGVSIDQVQDTLLWLQSNVSITLPHNMDLKSFDDLAKHLVNNKSLNGAIDEPKKADTLPATTIPILCNVDWSESLATAFIIQKLLLLKMLHASANSFPRVLLRDETLHKHADKAVLVCSNGCFVHRLVVSALLQGSTQQLKVLPVICEDSFRFPSKQFFTALAADVAPLMRVLREENERNGTPYEEDLFTYEQLQRAVKQCFAEIAVVCQPADYSSTEDVLDLKADAIYLRLSGNLKNALTKGSSGSMGNSNSLTGSESESMRLGSKGSCGSNDPLISVNLMPPCSALIGTEPERKEEVRHASGPVVQEGDDDECEV
jgi:hypothetical protein